MLNEAYFSIPSERVTWILSGLILEQGCPKVIRVVNGPEFTSKKFSSFCKYLQTKLRCIHPGRQVQRRYIERLNRTYREDVLDVILFDALTEVNAKFLEWQIEYNSNHPHQALNGMRTRSYKQQNIVQEIDKEFID